MDDEFRHAVQRKVYLASSIQNLDMEAARMQYEMRTLDQKLDELEESVDSFAIKVEAMEERMVRVTGKELKIAEQKR